MDDSEKLFDLQKKMEAAFKEKAQQQSVNRAQELNISQALLKYLDVLENRLDKLEQKVNKLNAARD